uniref:RanBD1 domain-containing protein n=1 Tax=Ditylum brightwellii TaxID=49249 RepID=A0A7S1Z143_9STRA|mmetsp:Transcript_22108/g.32904  ORF Transcript_22108/g.32904 Transcript_22108/m.32904 type:complete len:436 (+) Transcript_22108:248-1555(+)
MTTPDTETKAAEEIESKPVETKPEEEDKKTVKEDETKEEKTDDTPSSTDDSDKDKSSKEEPPKKKRGADRQITKDDGEEEDDDNEESSTNPGTGFKKASEEVLKKRRIIKARNPLATIPETKEEPAEDKKEDEEKKDTTNPFGAVQLSSPSKTNPFAAALSKTGTGFGSTFASTSTTFATAASSTSTTGFGSAFGSSTNSTAFGSTKSIFGSSFNSSSSPPPITFGSTPKTPTAPAIELPAETDVANGEENETCVFQTRAKLFKLDTTKPSSEPSPQESQDSIGSSMAATSVPPSSSSSLGPKKTNSTDADSKLEESQEEKQQWKEVGIGPVRILTLPSASTTRVVQRRESTPGGPGTKLILNVALRKECHVFRQADKYVRLATVEQEEGEEGSLSSVMYLWKVKTVGEADDLEKFLGEGIGGKEDDTAADDKEE